MNTATKFAGFALGLAAVFGLALATGALLGPEPAPPAAHDTEAHTGQAGTPEIPGGLMVTDRGYTLRLENPIATPAPDAVVRFRILDAEGAPVTTYLPEHEKDLHLIAVRRDMVGYQHVHPTLDAAGTWSAALDLTRAGEYRVFADFVPNGGPDLTLGADLRVAGDYDVTPLPPPATVATVGEYSVTLEGTVTPGAPAPLTLTVRRDGRPVTDLQPYLGAYGHLVALRAADLAYLHVHPQGHPGDGVTAPGPGITFEVSAPSAGDYRLFLDFRHGDVVRTAEFTLHIAPDTADSAEAEHGAPGRPHGDHGATPAPAHTH
ncbi:hypothetical protein [Nocardia bovistercoris]|uniref:Secreted protein n=1 Tax=Nocardia bovistercoris TaxID=2785916 RepID=A0A931IC87_9NOCA|nr:hypothetical protein [Nocardia bovistercoris]MBH0778977.1 hypothetical protein [Nocardia bovistercoris]